MVRQAAYDFKQGFLILDRTKQFDEKSFQKILKTCVAISNIGRGKKGYIIVGIADNDHTATRVESQYAINCLTYERFRISGIEHAGPFSSNYLVANGHRTSKLGLCSEAFGR